MTYTTAEHRRALESLRANIVYDTAPPTCPHCGQSASWFPGCAAEPGTGTTETPAGLYCDDACGWSETLPARDEDEAHDDREFRRWREGRDAA